MAIQQAIKLCILWMMYFLNQRLQMQFRFDPIKHYRATANSIMDQHAITALPTRKEVVWHQTLPFDNYSVFRILPSLFPPPLSPPTNYQTEGSGARLRHDGVDFTHRTNTLNYGSRMVGSVEYSHLANPLNLTYI